MPFERGTSRWAFARAVAKRAASDNRVRLRLALHAKEGATMQSDKLFLGIDFGGNAVKVGLVDEAGNL